MRTLCVLAMLGVVGGASACAKNSAVVDAHGGFEGPPAPTAYDGFHVDATVYCQTVAQQGLSRWDRDVLTICPDSGASCAISELVGGVARAVEVADARLALRASGGRLVVLKTSGALVLRSASGAETTLAAWASDPSVAADGGRVAYVTVADGVALPMGLVAAPGTATQVVLQDLRDESVRLIADDAAASSPLAVPNSDDVVYVSARSGLASIWRGNGEYELQVTNLDVEAGDQGVLPTFGSHVAWVPGARTLAFEVNTAGSEVWQYDVSLGTVELLGPGAWPQIAPDGTVLAASALMSDAACAVTYLANEDP